MIQGLSRSAPAGKDQGSSRATEARDEVVEDLQQQESRGGGGQTRWIGDRCEHVPQYKHGKVPSFLVSVKYCKRVSVVG
ncbi:hypothetical protein PspLS_05292 [Pyricularia sp. CBS 133598]|nr:hypothetical protein PspLS_05292 [Pyricularia sp. CBS 133598]